MRTRTSAAPLRGTAPGTTPGATADQQCCAEFARVGRRGFLGGALAAGSVLTLGSAVLTASPAMAGSAESVLVVLSMRGAADGLSLAVPYGDPVYYQARPGIAIPSGQLLATNGFFGLHPRLAALMPLWEAREMAVIHACGLPVANRSHFDAMEQLEDADPGSSTRRGWLNRLLGTTGEVSPLEGFYVGGGVVPTALFGPEATMAAADVNDVTIAGDDWGPGRRTSLHTLWNGDSTPLSAAMQVTTEAVDDFAPVHEAADNVAAYPDTDLARGLAAAARMIRGDVGIRVLTLDQGDWDMHTNLGTLGWGAMIRNAEEFAGAISAFFADLGTQRPKVTLVALSEFGRRIAENANYGLDHGYGNAMWAFGAGVQGKQYYGSFPTLQNTLDADLLVTTDYRNVLADVVESRFGASIPTVFPGLSRQRVGFMA